MSWAHVPIRVGTRFVFDGEIHEITAFIPSMTTVEVLLKGPTAFVRMSVVTLLSDQRARLIPQGDGPKADDPEDPAAVALLALADTDMKEVRERAGHIREVLTGYQSGSEETALDGEPRAEYDPNRKLRDRYRAKAAELGVTPRTIGRWVMAYRRRGEAGLVSRRKVQDPTIDRRWVDAASDIMQEHTDESMPSQRAVMLQVSERLELQFGKGVVKLPSRSTAYRHLRGLDNRNPVFGGTTKRNRDIARRPRRRYGKLRPTRPGEYLIIDTTRLDVFALDPATMRWMQVELTAVMDWYTRCIVALRLTPVSTKAVDAAALIYQVFRPLPAPTCWPDYAVWPYHGIPREVFIDPDKIDRIGKRLAGPALTPDTIIVDHGKIYMSEHLNSVCQRMGISIQPARLREGSDKAPLERFFGTVREGLLRYLPGYKGPDLNARGLDVEGHAFFYINELESILREWVATVYHHRKHESLFDPALPAARMSPAQMYCHGIARAGHIEVPRDPQLAYEFLRVEPRTIQAKGVTRNKLLYKGDVLTKLSQMTSPYEGKFKNKWPIHVDPDDISRVYIRHPKTREWHELLWEHASEVPVPFSDDGLRFARELAFQQHGVVDDIFALRELLSRWNLSLGVSPKERRIALRMSRQEQALSKQIETEDAAAVRALSSVAALQDERSTELALPASHTCPEASDDDDTSDFEDDYDDESYDWA
jgi:hypothetical protein